MSSKRAPTRTSSARSAAAPAALAPGPAAFAPAAEPPAAESPTARVLVSPAPRLPCAPPPAASLAYTEPAVDVEATTSSVVHWEWLLDGELFASSRHVQCTVLIKRMFGFDALTCPRCEGKMRVVATITAPWTVRRILESLGLRAYPLATALARDPTGQQTALGFNVGVE